MAWRVSIKRGQEEPHVMPAHYRLPIDAQKVVVDLLGTVRTEGPFPPNPTGIGSTAIREVLIRVFWED